MNNCIEHLKLSRPGLVLAVIADASSACNEIEAAFAVLEKETDALVKRMNERRSLRDLGVDCAGLDVAEWHLWKSTTLRRFYEIRGEVAGRLLPLCDERLAAEAESLKQRETGLARGLGKLLNNETAGIDLLGLLFRLTGGLSVNGDLRSVRNRWHNMCRESARMLKELPPAPAKTRTNNENTEELKNIIEKEIR